MKKAMIPFNLLLGAAVCAGAYFFAVRGGIGWKAFAAVSFVVMGLGNLGYGLRRRVRPAGFCTVMALGLVLACLGDIFLYYDFFSGAAFFAAGHIAYCAAYGLLRRWSGKDLLLIIGMFLPAGGFMAFAPGMEYPNAAMKAVCVIYALIITVMTGKALANALRFPCRLTVLLAVGSVLFFFSDLMLALSWFMGLGRLPSVLCVATYFPAQALLAGCLYEAVREPKQLKA